MMESLSGSFLGKKENEKGILVYPILPSPPRARAKVQALIGLTL
jgi:hypothetical protein